MAENDFLKRQIGSLKGQIEDKVSEARHMMERNQDNDTEMKRMRELVRSQEEQIREMQGWLDEQVMISRTKEEKESQKQAHEIAVLQEIQQVKLLFQEFVLVKDDIEKQMESMVRKILEREDEGSNEKMFPSALTKFKEGFSNRKIQDIMRQELSEIKELAEVVRDLASLLTQMVSEKKQIQASLKAELDLREQIESALERQEVENLTSDLLIMKIKTLEHALNQVTDILNGHQSMNDTTSMMNSASKHQSYMAYQSIKAFNMEVLDEKVKLVERVRMLESQLKESQMDIENLIARLSESEKENVEFKIQGEKRIDEEKRNLLHEVEEIKKREEQLEQEIKQKIEEEMIRIQNEQEKHLQHKFLKYLLDLIKTHDFDFSSTNYEQGLELCEGKIRQMQEKISVMQENKDLLMKERLIFEERFQEVAYENSMIAKKVDALQTQLSNNNFAYQQELKGLREDRDSINTNANLLMTRLRQTASELHETREEREKLRKENQELKEYLEELEHKQSLRLHGNPLQSNSLIVNSRPPLQRSEIISSPVVHRIGGGDQTHSTGLRRPLQQSENNQSLSPIQPYNTGRQGIDENQLSNLILDYKQENQKFSQKVQELQKKIQNTASPQKGVNQSQNPHQRAFSSKPLLRSNQQVSIEAPQRNDAQNRFYFSTVSPGDNLRPSQHHIPVFNNQVNCARGSSVGQRNLSCSLKKRQ